MRPRALTGTALAAAIALTSAAETYRGIDVAPEHRCAPYDRGDYRYSQSLEPRIVASIGKVYGPYTGTCFRSMAETDIEHMVATSEAHDSGLCAAPRSVKAAFASDLPDLLNLTLASPGVNRYSKSGKDVAGWTPALNGCWFVTRTLEVRRKHELTIDRREAPAPRRLLGHVCSLVASAVGRVLGHAIERSFAASRFAALLNRVCGRQSKKCLSRRCRKLSLM